LANLSIYDEENGMKNLILGIVVAIFISGCSTLQVQVGYDQEYDF